MRIRPPPRNSDSTQGNQSAKRSIFATIFEKLFGKRDPVKLAYAASDDAGLGVGELAAGRYDEWTAVYNISAHIVYMPDGTQLEAHSGLGSLLDDPSHVDEKMHGATPPNVYDLELREELFHGVRALRMIPEDERKVFGRAGLLVHTFMLGPNGDSNGCVYKPTWITRSSAWSWWQVCNDDAFRAVAQRTALDLPSDHREQ
jgi:hypothetical protein